MEFQDNESFDMDFSGNGQTPNPDAHSTFRKNNHEKVKNKKSTQFKNLSISNSKN